MIREPLSPFDSKKPLLLLLFLSLNGLSLGCFLSAAAVAGGFDEPSTPASDSFEFVPYAEDQTDSFFASPYETSAPVSSRSQPVAENARSLSALNSSVSYRQDDGVCRETSGDVICLSPNLARNLNW